MLFFYDGSNEFAITYDEFYTLLSKKKKIHRYIFFKRTFDVIVEITSAMLNGVEVTVLDGDFTEKELEYINVNVNNLNEFYEIDNLLEINNINNFNDLVKQNLNKTYIKIFTSGTTGKPKCFNHSLESLMRNIKVNISHRDDIWGLAYNITHFAGIQVLLQALMNGNTIIDLFADNAKNADRLLKRYKCTCLSATPTFFRNYIFTGEDKNFEIKAVTFGGEKFSNELIEKVKRKFPKSKIRNIYASTEVGSIFSGNNENFIIPDYLKNQIVISEQNHLLLHKSLISCNNQSDEWYDTNDIVKLNEDGSFKILSRDSDFINVGGYKVNTLEVEEAILQVDGVLDTVVWGRDNSVIGKILVADVKLNRGCEKESTKRQIVQYLKENLQSFKIPRIINLVDDINKTRTGKKVR